MSNKEIKVVIIIIYTLWSIVNAMQPNVIIVLTDDQDYLLDGMKPLTKTRHVIGHFGATFDNAFTTSPLCCPSRASLLSGMYTHNHHTLNNSLNGGCNDMFWRKNVEPYALPNILYENGYETFFGGKYLNQYRGEHRPPGWTVFNGLHGNSRYYNYTIYENGYNKTYSDIYLTDLLTERLLSFLNVHANSTRPFFALIAPPAPHSPFTPAPKYKDHFSGIKAIRTKNFNVVSDDKHWLVAKSEKLSNDTLQLMDEYFQRRWETLLSVDDMVASIVQCLESLSKLNNTYIIFTSDNGYHVGQFAQPFDKRQPYETDIRVPLLIRGPKIQHRLKIDSPVALIDLAPTILKWADIRIPLFMDGKVISTSKTDEDYHVEDNVLHRILLIEHHGEGNLNTYNPACPWHRDDRLFECLPEVACHCQDVWNNTYVCFRYINKQKDLLYCEFQDNASFVEVFNIKNDPFQLHNIVNDIHSNQRRIFSSALYNLTQCVGTTECSNVNV